MKKENKKYMNEGGDEGREDKSKEKTGRKRKVRLNEREKRLGSYAMYGKQRVESV